MIAIIAAMDEEVEAFKVLMQDLREDEYGFYLGTIADKEVVLAKSGIGKVGAAIVTTRLIDFYHPKLIINIGCAGALKEDIAIGDIVVATKVAHHDIDVPDWPKSFEAENIAYTTALELIDIIKEIKDDHVHVGPMVSGDSFICKASQTSDILKYFPQALCVEMEAAAVGQCATYFKVPFLILRAISDIAVVDGNEAVYEQFFKDAAINSARFTSDFIKRVNL